MRICTLVRLTTILLACLVLAGCGDPGAELFPPDFDYARWDSAHFQH